MPRGRLLFAGLIAVSAVMTADAAAQICPAWLNWACPDGASPAAKETQQPGQGNELARPKSNTSAERNTRRPSRAAIEATTNPKSPRIVPEGAQKTKAGRVPGRGDPRFARKDEQRGARPREMMNDREEALYQEFLMWFSEQQLNSPAFR